MYVHFVNLRYDNRILDDIEVYFVTEHANIHKEINPVSSIWMKQCCTVVLAVYEWNNVVLSLVEKLM